MDKTPRPGQQDPREREMALDVLRSRLSHENIYSRNIEADLTKLRHNDPMADEIIRHLAEKYFPGNQNMAQKEKAVRMLVTAFLLHHDTETTMQRFDIRAFLGELDELTSERLSDPPETSA